jgi:acetate kinase
MATRSGSIDPGLVLWLEERADIPPAELATALEHRSGLLGLAGTADMKEILDAETTGDPDAILAVDVYLHRLTAAVAALAAAMNGLEILIFTGGVGERAAQIRQRVTEGLRFLGVLTDSQPNRTLAPDCEISHPDASVRTLVIEAREDLQMSREARSALSLQIRIGTFASSAQRRCCSHI